MRCPTLWSIAGIRNDERASRFEMTIDGHLAELVYERDGDRLILVHTGVPGELEGRGIGGALVAAALDFAADNGLTVEARCAFARGWMERHPDATARVCVKWSPTEGAI